MLVGYGRVGKAFRELLHEKKREKFPFLEDVKIVGVVTRRGLMLGDKEEFTPNKQLDPLQSLEDLNPDIVIDASSPNYINAEPSFSLYISALKRGVNVITANKAPLALKFKELIDTAKKHDTKILYQATVMSGTPSINLLRVLKGSKIISLRGILNGTTNYILTLISQGVQFNDAVENAKLLGYAEPDPTLDLNGFDAASKITILANTAFNSNITVNDVKREGLSEDIIKKININNKKIKLIAYADKSEAWVRPIELDTTDPLYNVDYVENALEIVTDIQKVIIRGPGAGPKNAAFGLLSDLLLLLSGIDFIY
ncbi:MAG: homoserine dehydrogenase [Sulfolobaceae archaeon]